MTGKPTAAVLCTLMFTAELSSETCSKLCGYTCAGDVVPENADGTVGNGVVDVDDLLYILNQYGDACPFECCCGDIAPHQQDYIIDWKDIEKVLANWGTCSQ